LKRRTRGNASSASGFGGVVFMNTEVAAFLDSLKTGTHPAAAVPLLRAVWHGLRGEWEATHQTAQDDASAEGA